MNTLIVITHLFADEATVSEAIQQIMPASQTIALDIAAMDDADWDSLVAAMLAADKVITL